jgi:hypothetical protein
VASYERANQHFFALDLEPQSDMVAVRRVLDDWEQRGEAAYETCEPRAAGTFDDLPNADGRYRSEGP